MTTSNQVTVVGSANADLVVAVDRRPSGGETVLGGDLVVVPGGKGANQAVAAAGLGARVAFVGCVGDDDRGDLLRSSLTRAGADVTRLRTVPGVPTGTAMILLTPDGENSIVVSPGANAVLGEADVSGAAELLARTAVLVLQREVAPTVSHAAARAVRAAGGRILLSLAPSGPMPAELVGWADPLLVNEHEARDLLADLGAGAGPAAPEDLARALSGSGPRSVVITLGAAGAVMTEGDDVLRVPAPRVTPVDTTGAGDALAGALAWRLAAGDPLPAALSVAVRAAAQSVLRPGAQGSYPSAEELALS